MKAIGLLVTGVMFLTLIAFDGATANAEQPQSDAEAVDLSVAPSGSYHTDPRHAYITFSYDHFGMSHPHVRWRDWSGDLDWDADDPAASAVFVSIDAASVDSGVDEFDGHLRGESFFDVENHPEITFESTSIERTGPNTGLIEGKLSIKGVAKRVALEAKINGARNDDQRKLYRLGFSATTRVKRSDFGIDAYVPFVSDQIEITIEAEFVMPFEQE